jgi:hypothetical protein
MYKDKNRCERRPSHVLASSGRILGVPTHPGILRQIILLFYTKSSAYSKSNHLYASTTSSLSSHQTFLYLQSKPNHPLVYTKPSLFYPSKPGPPMFYVTGSKSGPNYPKIVHQTIHLFLSKLKLGTFHVLASPSRITGLLRIIAKFNPTLYLHQTTHLFFQ